MTAAKTAPMIILTRACFRWTSSAISPAVCGADWPGLRPGMRTFWLQEGQVTSWPGVVPGMKKFQPQLQLSDSLAMEWSLSLDASYWVQYYLIVGRSAGGRVQEKARSFVGPQIAAAGAPEAIGSQKLPAILGGEAAPPGSQAQRLVAREAVPVRLERVLDLRGDLDVSVGEAELARIEEHLRAPPDVRERIDQGLETGGGG